MIGGTGRTESKLTGHMPSQGGDCLEPRTMGGDEVVGPNLLEGPYGLFYTVGRGVNEMKPSNDGMDLLYPRQLLGLCHNIDNTDVGAS